MERFLHIAELEVRIGVKDLVGRHPLGDHPDDRRDRDPQASDTRDAVHLVSANGDPRESHEQRVPAPITETAAAVRSLVLMQAPGVVGAAADRADPKREDIMSESRLVDVTGRMRSPAATPGHWAGCAPPNKGQRYPADPPMVEEIILVMRQAGPGSYADRTRGLIAILWRAGLRISEALALTESDLDPKTGSVLVRVGKGGKRRTVGMDDWAWEHVARWTEHRIELPIGPLFCILAGPTRGRGWSATAARGELRQLAAQAGVRRRFAPHQLRHAHAIEMAHEGIPLPIIQRQLGHAHLGITSIYLQGIDTREIVDTVHHRVRR